MKAKLGFVLSSNRYYTLLVLPYKFFHIKYKKMQIKIKKYYVINYRNEYVMGDVILFGPKKNTIYIYVI